MPRHSTHRKTHSHAALCVDDGIARVDEAPPQSVPVLFRLERRALLNDADDLLADLPATARDRILAATPRDTVIGWGQLEWAQEASVLEDASRLLDEDDPATTPSTR